VHILYTLHTKKPCSVGLIVFDQTDEHM